MKTKTKQLREMTKEELQKKITDLSHEFRTLRFAQAKGEQKNPLQKRNVRRAIARALTIKKEKGWA